RSLNPDLPVWLEGIYHKLHAKDPAQRFQSAAAVAELLERCLAHVQQPDHQPLPRLAAELGRQLPRPGRPRRRRAWLVAAGVLAVGGLVTAALAFGLGLGAKHHTGTGEPVTTAAPLPAPEPARAVPWDDVRDDSVELRARLTRFYQSFDPAPAGDAGPEP